MNKDCEFELAVDHYQGEDKQKVSLLKDTSQLNLENCETYSAKREKLKLSSITSQIVLFKFMTGIFWLAQAYFFQQAGFIAGTIVFILSYYFNWYFSDILCKIADDVELDKNNGHEINTYDELMAHVLKGKSYQCILVFINNLILAQCNLIFVSGGVLLFSRILEQRGIELWVGKIIGTLVILIIFLLVLLPENLKYPGFITSTFACILMCIVICQQSYTYLTDESTTKKTFNYFDIEGGFKLYVATVGAISCTFMIQSNRQYTAQRRNYGKQIVSPYLFSFCIQIMIVYLIYQCVGNEGIKEIISDYYQGNNFMQICFVLYYLAVICFGCAFQMNLSFILEGYGCMNNWIRNGTQDYDMCRLAMLRVSQVLLMYGFINIPMNFLFLSQLVACLMFLSNYYIPILLKYTWKDYSLKTKIHDFILIIFHVAANIVAILSLFKDKQ